MAITKATFYPHGVLMIFSPYNGKRIIERFRSNYKVTDHSGNRNSPRECQRRMRQMAKQA